MYSKHRTSNVLPHPLDSPYFIATELQKASHITQNPQIKYLKNSNPIHTMSHTQYGTPILINSTRNSVSTLKRIDLTSDNTFKYDENWLQQRIFETPALLPVNEVDPIFGPLIPVCRELMTNVGPIDNIFINELGMLTLVECKLWRNPEARRKVVGQILDYAQEFSRMSFDDLSQRIRQNTGRSGNPLFDIIAEQTEDCVEKDFTDSVIRNLRRGRFLLLIVGDGIRESVEQISEYLQVHAHLNFTFALVEQALYSSSDDPDTILIQPRVLAKTVEIERAVVRIENNSIECAAPTVERDKTVTTRSTKNSRKSITEQYLFEELEQSAPETVAELSDLFELLKQRDFELAYGSSGISVKTDKFNYISFRPDGTIRNYGCGENTEGAAYLEALSDLIPNSYISEAKGGWRSYVRHTDDTDVHIKEVLAVKEQWLSLIEQTRYTFNQ